MIYVLFLHLTFPPLQLGRDILLGISPTKTASQNHVYVHFRTPATCFFQKSESTAVVLYICCKQGGPSLNMGTGLARLALVCMAQRAPGHVSGCEEKVYPLWHPGANGTCRAGILWKMYFSCGRVTFFVGVPAKRGKPQKRRATHTQAPCTPSGLRTAQASSP